MNTKFYDKVRYNDATGCMEWTGPFLSGRDYGLYSAPGGLRYAHRFRYEIETGLEIPKSIMVCHRCDNPKCVTFVHFFLGTHQDNMDDMRRKGRGRWAHGETHSEVTVSDELMHLALAEYSAGGATQVEIARRLGVSQPTFSRWVNKVNRRK